MDLSDLLSSLSESDISQLKQTAAGLLGGLNSQNNGSAQQSAPQEQTDEEMEYDAEESVSTLATPAGRGDGLPSLDGITAALGALGSFGGGADSAFTQTLARMGGALNAPDVRCNFLLSLKPLLKEQRHERVEQAVKMLRLMNLLPILRESGLFRGFLQ